MLAFWKRYCCPDWITTNKLEHNEKNWHECRNGCQIAVSCLFTGGRQVAQECDIAEGTLSWIFVYPGIYHHKVHHVPSYELCRDWRNKTMASQKKSTESKGGRWSILISHDMRKNIMVGRHCINIVALNLESTWHRYSLGNLISISRHMLQLTIKFAMTTSIQCQTPNNSSSFHVKWCYPTSEVEQHYKDTRINIADWHVDDGATVHPSAVLF